MIDFTPFLEAPLAIQLHAIAALEALILGPFILFSSRRGRLHKTLGYIWVTNMGIATLTSFFITELRMFGPYSFIHLLAVFSAVALVRAIQHARNGNYRAHRGVMRGLYFGGLVGAGVFAFLPGRVMNRMLFGGESTLGFALIATAAGIWAAYYFGRPIIMRNRLAG